MAVKIEEITNQIKERNISSENIKYIINLFPIDIKIK